MNLKYKLLVSIVFFGATGHQTLAQYNQKVGPNQLIICPLRVIDLANPGIELSYQRAYGKRSATMVSAAYMTDLTRVLYVDNYKGWRFAAEQKYFFRPMRRARVYVAVELSYLKVSFDDQSYFKADTGRNTPEYLDDFTINKTNITINPKFGVQIPVWHFVFDFSAGLGLKHRKVVRSGLIDPNAYEPPSRYPNINFENSRPGNDFTPNISLHARIAFEF